MTKDYDAGGQTTSNRLPEAQCASSSASPSLDVSSLIERLRDIWPSQDRPMALEAAAALSALKERVAEWEKVYWKQTFTLRARADRAEAALAEYRAKTIEECRAACIGEKLDAISTSEEADYAYNRACDHCANACCALAIKPKE